MEIDLCYADATLENESLWDAIAVDLQSNGVAIIDNLPHTLASIHRRGFSTARDALIRIREQESTFLANNVVGGDVTVASSAASTAVPWINPGADSAHATGYHPASDPNRSISRYNRHREGFVFSNGNLFHMAGLPDFYPSTSAMLNSLYAIADCVLQAIDRKLELPPRWLQENLGCTIDHCQWHIKRYVFEEPNLSATATVTTACLDDPHVLLPLHTDPSLISIVIHDKPGKNPGAMGLEYCCHGQWIPVPWHGHQVATIFVGSVLSYLTGGTWPCAKHRVIRVDDDDICCDERSRNQRHRMAATLFLRPKGTTMLSVPPSPYLSAVSLKKKISFDNWNARVARNYERKKS